MTTTKSTSTTTSGTSTGTSSSSGYWFPQMRVSEIVQVIDGWGFQVSDLHIQKPTAETVQAIYAVFLQQITGLTVEALEEPVREALARAGEEFADLYASGLSLNLFLYHVHRLASAACVPDFSIADLAYPDPERTRLILSAIINFIKFAEENEGFLKGLQGQAVGMVEERERLGEVNREMGERIGRIEAQRQAEEPECRRLEEENKALDVQLLAIKKEQEQTHKEIEALKATRAAVTHQKQTLTQDLANVSAAISSTRARIVQSPERIKRSIQDMSGLIGEEKRGVSAQERRARELGRKLEALGGFEEDIKTAIDELRDIQTEHELLEATVKKLESVRQETAKKTIERDQLSARADRATRQLSLATSKLARAHEMAEDRKHKAQEAIERLRREYQEMSEERRENDRAVEGKRREGEEVERMMAEHIKTSEAELNMLLAKYWNLRHQTEVYMETLANKFGIEKVDA